MKNWIWLIRTIIENRKNIYKAIELSRKAPFSTIALHHTIDKIIEAGPPQSNSQDK